MTKTDKFLNALESGQMLTIKQAVRRFRFASKNSLTGTVSKLRYAGIKIDGAFIRDSRGRETFKYRIAA